MRTGAQIMDSLLAHTFRQSKISISFNLIYLALLTRSSCREWVTEYAGLLITSDEARALPPDNQTWLRTLASSFLEVDGNPSHFPNGHIDMAQRHVLGLLINHSFKRQNCSFETEDWASQDLVSADGLSYSKCIFIRATRDILPNEQLLVSYGASASKFPNLPL
jgi:hypothetical protein